MSWEAELALMLKDRDNQRPPAPCIGKLVSPIKDGLVISLGEKIVLSQEKLILSRSACWQLLRADPGTEVILMPAESGQTYFVIGAVARP